jgi:hypothetical protein
MHLSTGGKGAFGNGAEGDKVPFVGRKRFIKKQKNLYTSPIPGPADITVAPPRRSRGSTSSEDSNASYDSIKAPYTTKVSVKVGATPDFQHEQLLDMSAAVQPQTIHHHDGQVETVNRAL